MGRRDRHGGRAYADQSLATFVGGKAAFLPAAAADMCGCGLLTPSPGSSVSNTAHNHGQPAPLLRSRRGTRAAGALTRSPRQYREKS
jgi:hypothetical protein